MGTEQRAKAGLQPRQGFAICELNPSPVPLSSPTLPLSQHSLFSHSWNASQPHRALYARGNLAASQHWQRPSPGCGIYMATAIPGCTHVDTAELEVAGILSPSLLSSLPMPHFSVKKKRPNQIPFFKLLKIAQALLFTHNQIHIFFSVQWLPRAKVQVEHWNSHGLNHQWDTSGADADVPSLDLLRAWTVLGACAPELPSGSFPVPASCSNQHCLQQMCHM